MFDGIAKQYVKMVEERMISEMSVPLIGDVSGLKTDEEQTLIAKKTEGWDKISTLSGGVELRNRGNVYTSVLGDKAVHYSVISHHSGNSNGIPFDHAKQDIVVQSRDCPKGISREAALHIVDHTKTPIVTDARQTESGHKMWRGMIPQAMNAGHPVHMFDGEKLHETTLDNVVDHINTYYGPGKEKHAMVIMPKEKSNA